MEDVVWVKYCDQNLVVFDVLGEEGISILKLKRIQVVDYQFMLKIVKELDEDCQLRISDWM